MREMHLRGDEKVKGAGEGGFSIISGTTCACRKKDQRYGKYMKQEGKHLCHDKYAFSLDR
jgi:hypothetical protein